MGGERRAQPEQPHPEGRCQQRDRIGACVGHGQPRVRRGERPLPSLLGLQELESWFNPFWSNSALFWLQMSTDYDLETKQLVFHAMRNFEKDEQVTLSCKQTKANSFHTRMKLTVIEWRKKGRGNLCCIMRKISILISGEPKIVKGVHDSKSQSSTVWLLFY